MKNLTMLVLFETAAGYAIFKVRFSQIINTESCTRCLRFVWFSHNSLKNVFQLLDEKKIKATDNLFKDFETPEKANKMYVLCESMYAQEGLK